MTWSPAFSRALGSLVVFTSSSHLLVKIFFFPLIYCCDSFCFALTTRNQKALDWKIKVRKWEPLLDWSFCLLNFSFSLCLQLIHFSSFDNIICLSITEGQDQNDRDWVLGVLVRTLGKIFFLSKSLIAWLLSERDSIVKTFFNRIKLIRKVYRGTLQFPFSTIKSQETSTWGFKIL